MDLTGLYLQESAKFALFAQQAKRDNASGAVNAAKAALDIVKKEQSTVSDVKKELIHSIKKLESELEPLKARLLSLEGKYNADLKSAQDSQSFADLLTAYKLGADLGTLKHDSAEKFIAICEKNIAITNLKNSDADEKLNAALKAVDDASVAFTDLQNEYDATKSTFEKNWPLAGTLTFDPLSMEKLASELSDSNTAMKKSNLDLLDAQATIEKLKGQIGGSANVTKQLKDTKNQLQESVAMVTKLTSDLQNEKSSRTKAEKNLKKAESIIHSHEDTAAKGRTTIARLSEELNYTKLSNETLNNNIDKAHREVNELRKDLDDANNEIDEAHKEFDEVEEKLKEAQKEVESLNKYCENIQEHLNVANHEIDEYITDKDAHMEEIKELRAIIAGLEASQKTADGLLHVSIENISIPEGSVAYFGLEDGNELQHASVDRISTPEGSVTCVGVENGGVCSVISSPK